MEVFINNNNNVGRTRRLADDDLYERNANASSIVSSGNIGAGDCNERTDSSADDDCDNEILNRNYTNTSGLVGLQNIANTCYMNAALQALSNTPPLTRYFLECGDIIEANCDMAGPNSSQRKTGLAKSYHRLVKDMWQKHARTNGYIVPTGILYGIRNVHPMFRGFQQHDTQEFLRCFMDQLHEELKEVTPPPPDVLVRNTSSASNLSGVSIGAIDSPQIVSDDDRSACSTPLSQSEAEYETCDSGVSEQSSLSDEMSILCSTKSTTKPASSAMSASITSSGVGSCYGIQLHSAPTSAYSRSPSPTASQRTIKSVQSSSSKFTGHRSNSVSSLNSMTNLSAGASSPQQMHPDGSSASGAAKLPHRSIISDVFDGKLLSSVQCLTCDRISTREETFQDLSLPIPGKDHLNVLHQSQGMLTPMSSSNALNCPEGVSAPTLVRDVIFYLFFICLKSQDGWLWWIWNWVRSFFWGPAVSLHDCMSAFFSADELKGDNMYRYLTPIPSTQIARYNLIDFAAARSATSCGMASNFRECLRCPKCFAFT